MVVFVQWCKRYFVLKLFIFIQKNLMQAQSVIHVIEGLSLNLFTCVVNCEKHLEVIIFLCCKKKIENSAVILTSWFNG